MRQKAKVDDNQGEIVDALLELPGVSVRSLAKAGDGLPDLLVGLDGGLGQDGAGAGPSARGDHEGL